MKKWFSLFIGLICFHQLFGDVKLPRLISSGMILQRDADLNLWGWANAGEKVLISFLDHEYSIVTGDSGIWFVPIPPQKAGGPFKMVIQADNRIELNNIFVGDVWLCSGQSNMELPVRRVRSLYEDEIKKAHNPMIRQFIVPQQYDFKTAQSDLTGGEWISCDSLTVLNFSAVGWFFAKSLYSTYGVAIGLINASLGGSPAEAWMSDSALRAFPNYQQEAYRFRSDSLIKKIQSDDRQRINRWYWQSTAIDQGNAPGQIPWSAAVLDDGDWDSMSLPGYWDEEKQKPINGVVWFRRSFSLDNCNLSLPARLNLGAIVDADSVFVNDTFVGTTSYQYPPRIYQVPAGILKEGKNTIVIRVISTAGQGGFVPDKEYALHIGNQTIDLQGLWRTKVGAQMDPLAGETFIRWKPMGLFNAMIHPLTSYGIKGVIWYQGESNTGKPKEYASLFSALINDWRHHFQQKELPFLFVQLSSFMKPWPSPGESNWAATRESQMKALSLPHTAMAVTIDVGEWNDVHPLNKKTVGERLSLAAQNIAYGNQSIVCSGPVLKNWRVRRNKIELLFTSVAGKLQTINGDALQQIAISGNNKKFVWAKSVIKKSKIIVWNDSVAYPVAVRYGWADNPQGANLINGIGLPASPFRTDEW